MTVELPTIPTQTTSNGSRAVTELAQLLLNRAKSYFAVADLQLPDYKLD